MLNRKPLSLCSVLVLLVLLLSPQLYADEMKKWPRDVKVSSGTITIYQPQVESLTGNILKGRTAISYVGKNGGDPVFGAAWLTARVRIDRSSGRVHFETLEVTDTRFPQENPKVVAEFSAAVSEGVKRGNLTSSLDELTTALAAVAEEQKTAAKLNNDPPDIIYTDTPAILVVIDGKTVLQKIENSDFQAVVNSPYPLFYGSKAKVWYLNAAEKVWYSAPKVDGPWKFTDKAPAELVSMVQSKASTASEAKQKPEASDVRITAANAPSIVVVHKPSELVVSNGKAEFAPLTDDLLAMSNTESNVFMDLKSQHYYLIISGRWYTSSSMTGKWHYVAADSLPATFAKIPKGSRYADVRSSIAGTDEAREAVMDAQIPQTAAVQRGEVDIKVSYDGKPDFKDIAGTDLKFAVNCSETVIQAGKQFYMVKDAVWYLAATATGPWSVSDHAPPGIDKVPPSSPVYNTKYVYVYNSTPEVVYVGYTPGYVGSYIYGPTIVYGTGYYYYPYVTPYYYYPRPATWGFSVSYNPWTGWGFGMSWSSGPFRVGFYTGGGYHGRYWGGHRYYGPRGYRRSYTQVNINNSRTINNYGNRSNLYRGNSQRANVQSSINSRSLSSADRQSMQQRASSVNRGTAAAAVGGAALGGAAVRGASSRPNNVFTDSQGNVLRNNGGQWQTRNNGQWQDRASSTAAARPQSTTRQAATRAQSSGYTRPSSMDRQQHSRQRATERVQRSSRPSTSRSRGGSRGGGGRRR